MDVLNALQIFADGYIGHSVGELGCAYADGCLTAEQTVLTAYYRALALSETKVPPGAMASIGKLVMNLRKRSVYYSINRLPSIITAILVVIIRSYRNIVRRIDENLTERRGCSLP